MDYRQINDAGRLVLIRMEVATTLRLWVEASPNTESDPDTRHTRLFHLSFPGEIMALSTLHASYIRPNTPGPEAGAHLQIHDASSFLDYVRTETYAASTMIHPLRHIRLITEETIIDVVTLTPPDMEEISLAGH